jgi:hypothetical protein
MSGDPVRFSLSTTDASLFPILEFEVDGVVYHTKRFTRTVIRRLQELDARLREGDLDAIFSHLAEITDLPEAVIAELDVNQVSALIKHITANAIKATEGAEKKV